MARNLASTSSQYLENGAAVITTEPVTLACRFRVPSLPGAAQTLLGLSQSGGTARCLLQVSSNNKLTVFSGATGNGATGTVEHATTLSTNTWYSGVGVFASTSSRLCYLDNVASSVSTTTVSMSGVNRTNVGARYNTTIGTFFNGLVAEAAIWSVALDVAEIAALAAGSCPLLVRPGALAAYWPLIGRNSPETCEKGSYNLSLSNAPTTADHCRVIRRRASRRRVA